MKREIRLAIYIRPRGGEKSENSSQSSQRQLFITPREVSKGGRDGLGDL